MSGSVSPRDNPAKDPDELQAASGRGTPDGNR